MFSFILKVVSYSGRVGSVSGINTIIKYLISFVLLCLSNVAISEEIEFSINCKILDQVVLEVQDGKSKKYSGFDEVNVGDSISITFMFTDDLYGSKTYRIMITNSQFPTVFINNSVHPSDFNIIKRGTDSGQFIWHSIINDSSYGGPEDGAYVVSLEDSYMMLEGPLGSMITGRRYFKDDWNFVIKSGVFRNNLLQTSNCMSVPADYNRMLKKVRDYHKANPEKPK